MSEVPGIDPEAVEAFLRGVLPELAGPPRFELISGGRSNLSYRVSIGGRDLVLRRPPLGHVLPTAHDMGREYRVLRALSATEVPVPRPLAFCDDPSRIGAPFYLMEYRPGVVLDRELPPGFAETREQRRRIGLAVAETLARLHAVDPERVGLGDFGRPEGFVERQVRRWARQWEGNRVAPLPEVDELLRRLGRALPPSGDAAIVHGDYRLGNLALDPADPGRIAAIYDWEMSTLGDPLCDLGYTLIYWTEAGEEGAGGIGGGGVGSVTAFPGFPSREELAAAYARASGREIHHLDFYRVLALTKLAIISEGIYKRVRMGAAVGADLESIERPTPALAARALGIADGAEDRRLRG